MKLNKAAGALLAVVLCNASTLFGADDNMVSVKPNGCKGPVLCPTFSVLDDKGPCCHTWHVDVGLLYQQPGFSGMLSGVSYLGTYNEGSTEETFKDQNIQPMQESFDYSLGLTVSLGHLINHDDWLILARFDWLSANMTNKHEQTNQFYAANPNFNFYVMLGTEWAEQVDYFTTVNYSANMDIYALDVLLCRGSFHSRCYSLDPYVGVKALWYYDNQVSTYSEAGKPGTLILTNKNVPSLTQTQDNWGAGPMFGFQGEFHITHGFSVFSDSDIGVLYGSSSNSSVSNLSADGTAIENAQTITNSNPTNGGQLYLPVRSIIGVKLSQYCLNDAHFIAVKLGYDARVVLTSPSYTSTVSVSGSGAVTTNVSNDIFMTGLYANFEWNF